MHALHSPFIVVLCGCLVDQQLGQPAADVLGSMGRRGAVVHSLRSACIVVLCGCLVDQQLG
jgi:hypothetical protein